MKIKQLFINRKNKLMITTALIIFIFIGILFTYWTINETDKQLKDDLLKVGNLVSKSINTRELKLLTGTSADLNSPYYQRYKEQLSEMQKSLSKSRFFYLVGLKDNGSVFIYMDSDPVDSKDYSPPGQIYTESPKIINEVFKTSASAVDGPITDRWGRWISVYVPIKEHGDGKVLAVLGIDIDADNWNTKIIKSASLSVALFFIILIILIFVILIYRSRQLIKSHQQEIIESEKRFKILFKDSPDAYLILVDGIITDCNSSTEILLGAEKTNIIGKSIVELSPVFQPDGKKSAQLVNEKINNALKNGSHTYEWAHRRFDGENFWAEVSVSSLTLESKPALFVALRDVTQRKFSEEELIQINEQLRLTNEIVETNLYEKNSLIEELSETQEKLEKINSEKDKFFSIIAHDLKSPFSGFLSVTKMMSEDVSYFTMEEIQDLSKDMQNSAKNLYKLLENLLEWSRMKRGVTEFKPEECNLCLIVKQDLDIQSEVAKLKEIEFINNISDDIIVTADESMLNAILRNLISNAIKFTPRGGKVEVGAKFNNFENKFDIYIKDNGIGMSKDTINKLFKIDQKIFSLGTEGEPSTGLGLLLCKEFIEKHEGKIRVESEEGKGSTFYFSL